MPSPRDLRLLSYFVQIARSGSIRGAAKQMSLSPPVLSEALSELEDVLGVTLVTRTTRSMALTEAGQAVLADAASAMEAADAAMLAATGGGPRLNGVVRLTVPVELAVAWLQPILNGFGQAAPDVLLEIEAEDSVTPLSVSQFDLAIRTSYGPEPRETDVMCKLDLKLVCVPALRSSSRESLVEGLERIGIVGPATAGNGRSMIRARSKGKLLQEVEAPCRIVVNNRAVSYQLALAGSGAALLIGLTVEKDLAAGRLVEVDERYDFGYVNVRIVTRDKYPSPAVRAFIAYLEDQFAERAQT